MLQREKTKPKREINRCSEQPTVAFIAVCFGSLHLKLNMCHCVQSQKQCVWVCVKRC